MQETTRGETVLVFRIKRVPIAHTRSGQETLTYTQKSVVRTLLDKVVQDRIALLIEVTHQCKTRSKLERTQTVPRCRESIKECRDAFTQGKVRMGAQHVGGHHRRVSVVVFVLDPPLCDGTLVFFFTSECIETHTLRHDRVEHGAINIAEDAIQESSFNRRAASLRSDLGEHFHDLLLQCVRCVCRHFSCGLVLFL